MLNTYTIYYLKSYTEMFSYFSGGYNYTIDKMLVVAIDEKKARKAFMEYYPKYYIIEIR